MHTYRPIRRTTTPEEEHETSRVQFAQTKKNDTNRFTNASYVESLMGGMRPTEESKLHGLAISTIDRHFRYFTVWLFGTWTLLVTLMYGVLVPKEDIVYLSGLEQRAAFTSMSLIFVSFLSRIIPLLGMGKMSRVYGGLRSEGFRSSGGEGGVRRMWENVTKNMSGILLGGLSIQVVAFMTDFLMAFFPVPVVLDPVLGTRVHVLRWCEWFPCATFMTFMMEGADLFWSTDGDLARERIDGRDNMEDGPPPDFFRRKYMHAATQGGAVFLGLIFPFCPGFKTWMCAMTLAVILYLTNYPRMIQRRSEIPKILREGATVEEAERYNSAVTALRLRYICIAVWSIIVALYFVSSIGPYFAPEGSILRNPAANMICECFFDVLSKVLFLVTIMDVHQAIFDPFARSERRIEELRKLMSAVWESSSDPIAISVKTGPAGGVTTLLSPAFFALGGGRGALRRLSKDEIKDLFFNKSVLFKLSEEVFTRGSDGNGEEMTCEIKSEDILSVNYTEFSTGLGQTSGVVFAGQLITPEMGSLRAVAESVVKAWQNTGQHVFTHELCWTSENKRDIQVFSEAKVSRLDENSLIVIIRDISERVKIFETEKKILYEATSRQKDAEANRFTRHEVKNGLLAAIGLYESLCEAQRSHLVKDVVANVGFGLGESDDSANVVRCMNELGKSLHETLDTIMVEAMTRDLIHDVYRPHRERMDLATAISGSADNYAYSFGSMGNLCRFPLITKPSPLPKFYLDPNLLRYLHRQVLSNACKYGKIGGTVLTEIIFDEVGKKLKINVINLPGEFHDKLVDMGDAAERAVFRKGSQIHENIIIDGGSTTASSAKKTEMATHPGDGGW
jgi:signal transduction histidine kinase